MLIEQSASLAGPVVKAPQSGFEQSIAARLLSVSTMEAEDVPKARISLAQQVIALV